MTMIDNKDADGRDPKGELADRIKAANLDRRTAQHNRTTDRMVMMKVTRMKALGIDVGLDGQYGRFRVTNSNGDRDLSPRGTNREILDWLTAYQMGWEDRGRKVGYDGD